MNKLFLAAAIGFSLCTTGIRAQQKNLGVKFEESLQHYYVLKNALANDDPGAAKAAAVSFRQVLQEQPLVKPANKGLQNLWSSQSVSMTASLDALNKTADLSIQRKQLEAISTSMIKLTRTLKMNKNPVFLEYCPMGKYTWLNEDQTIKNPYYGLKMQECGTVQETL